MKPPFNKQRGYVRASRPSHATGDTVPRSDDDAEPHLQPAEHLARDQTRQERIEAHAARVEREAAALGTPLVDARPNGAERFVKPEKREAVRRLAAEGLSVWQIAVRLELAIRTVERLLREEGAA